VTEALDLHRRGAENAELRRIRMGMGSRIGLRQPVLIQFIFSLLSAFSAPLR